MDDDSQEEHRRRSGSGMGIDGTLDLTPIYGRDISTVPLEDLFPLPWSIHSTPSLSSDRVDEDPTTGQAPSFSSPLGPRQSDLSAVSSIRLWQEEDTLTIEKSRVLEQLRNMTTEVDDLESRLQAIKRKRARAANAALQKVKDNQEAEAQEMRQILGSVHHLSISEQPNAARDTGSGSAQGSTRTPLTTLSTHAISNIDVDMIRRLQTFTNTTFTSIQNQLLTPEDGAVARRYHITGTCFQLDFKVEFTVREPSLNLQDVHVQVPRSVQNELGGFVSRVQSQSLLLPFFRTFSQYAQMDYDRQSVMTKLAKSFPQLIKMSHSMRRLSKSTRSASTAGDMPPSTVSPAGPGVQSMVFCGSRKSSPELVFHWVIDVTEQGKIVPHVRLLPRMPKKWRVADEKGTLDGIPTHFARLLQLKGTENAVAVLLRCVFGRKVAEERAAAEEEEEEEES
ncbi:hypothetical protein B0O80DRAFT_492371 [Mortierella sp. GBAus27b]|nr:hypothetical protein B0O80DRAFT_492371 [Mortierella sp. GBAus27b]